MPASRSLRPCRWCRFQRGCLRNNKGSDQVVQGLSRGREGGVIRRDEGGAPRFDAPAGAISGFCFPGFTLKKGCNPSLSVGVLFLGFQSDDLFTGVVAPTTCSLTTCLITCKGIHFHLSKSRKGIHFHLNLRRCGYSLSPIKTHLGHSDLWINPSAKASLAGCGTARGQFCGEKRVLTATLRVKAPLPVGWRDWRARELTHPEPSSS